MDGSLLFCDVGTMNDSSNDEQPMGENEFYHESSRIVLPFMNGLDSDDEFDLEDEEDEGEEEGSIPVTMNDWFNSTVNLSFRCDGLDADEEILSEDLATPCCEKREEVRCDVDDSKAFDDSTDRIGGDVKGNGDSFDVKTPASSTYPTLPIMDDEMHKTPVSSNIQPNFPDLENGHDPSLPTLTPVPVSEPSQVDQGTKESPTSVLELGETQYPATKESDLIPLGDHEFEYEIDECAERLSSVKLETKDIV
ncbi:MAG: hypothetical protein SGARI_003099, partial [Bacillariaceae sp.]